MSCAPWLCKNRLLLLLAVTLLTVVKIAAADVVYNISLTDPLALDTVTGTLTLSADTGVVSPSGGVGGGILLDWDVSATMPTSIGVVTLGPLTFPGSLVRGFAHATPTEIYLTAAAPFDRLSFSNRIATPDGDIIAFSFESTPQGNFGQVTLEHRITGQVDATGGFAIPIGADGRFVIAIRAAAVPEPATGALLGIALAFLGFARRRARGRQFAAV